jgi:hypothetical protein
MMTKNPEVALSPFARRSIFWYLGVLIILLAFGAPSGGLIDIPISFFLKNQLGLDAHEVANFRLVVAIPLYLSFVFGFIRDTWNPFGLRDRGFMILFGGICATLYVVFAFISPTYRVLIAADILLTISFLFVSSAQNGLTSMLAQQHRITGEMSALWNILLSIPTVAALLAGGAISDYLEGKNGNQVARVLFIIGAVIMASVACYATWKPIVVFSSFEYRATQNRFKELKRLVCYWPMVPAQLIWLLWNFAPGSATPLQYHLQNELHATDAEWGQWNAIFTASFVPTFMLFGLLSRRFSLNALLFWGTIVAIPQMVPLLFIHSIGGALAAAVPIGLMGGMATAAYLDLIIRSCPPGLQGTTLMMSSSIYFAVSRFGDVLGTNLYEHYGGFNICVVATTIVYSAILPALLLVPNKLKDSPTGSLSDTMQRE